MNNPYQPQQPQWGQPQQPNPYQQPQWGGQPAPQPGYPQQGAPTPPPGYQQPQGPGGPGGAPYGSAPYGGPQQQPKKSDGGMKKPLLYGIVGLVLIGVVFGVLAVLGVFTSKVLDTKAVQQGVQKVLTENFGIAKVTGVSCPNQPAIKAGNTFTCTASIDGKQRQVPVKVTNDSGEYEVGQPK
ncbi:DUF4333 domain-containing protein [Crossiella sp. SN42]|uniref:DUF4333 domain-containing protein n=1 Tax=Crossiella sp. SN42 TaxID=2944808 RepID=UPI00207C6ADF|nr:DUF4333 domain-containing protein [Crossiella sp. SN42]MCO1577506.1 DUF4333 domain-containing protein [Crossiella sp. SN42]